MLEMSIADILGDRVKSMPGMNTATPRIGDRLMPKRSREAGMAIAFEYTPVDTY